MCGWCPAQQLAGSRPIGFCPPILDPLPRREAPGHRYLMVGLDAAGLLPTTIPLLSCPPHRPIVPSVLLVPHPLPSLPRLIAPTSPSLFPIFAHLMSLSDIITRRGRIFGQYKFCIRSYRKGISIFCGFRRRIEPKIYRTLDTFFSDFFS